MGYIFDPKSQSELGKCTSTMPFPRSQEMSTLLSEAALRNYRAVLLPRCGDGGAGCQTGLPHCGPLVV